MLNAFFFSFPEKEDPRWLNLGLVLQKGMKKIKWNLSGASIITTNGLFSSFSSRYILAFFTHCISSILWFWGGLSGFTKDATVSCNSLSFGLL